jgi:hypothetical protein
MRMKLKQAIVASGRTQRAYSLRWRIPEGRLSAIVRGRCEPTEREEAVIARDLRCSPDGLFEQIPLRAAS